MTPEIALICAPHGTDATAIHAWLRESGIDARSVDSVREIVALLSHDAVFVVLTEEALFDPDLKFLGMWLGSQQEWSDLPFILLTSHGGSLERNPVAARHLETLGNVTFLERPFHPTTLVSLAKAALRARRRQYEARSRLETIRLGERQLLLALSAARLGTWSLRLPGRIYETSPEHKAHHGRSADQPFTSADLAAGMHPDDRDTLRDYVTKAMQTPGDYNVEYRFILPQGGVRWIQARGRIDHGEDGKTVHMSGVSNDVTEAKQAEAALQQSESRFRAAVEAVQGVVWTNTADGEMVGEQPGWAMLTGQSKEDYQGYGWSKAVHPDDAQPTVDAWNLAVAARQPFVFEHRVRRANGEWGEFSIRAIPALEADGSIREWVGVHTDITQQRANERQIVELANSLEARVADATADLVSSQARLRSIFESSFQYLGEMEPDGRQADANVTSLAGIGRGRNDVVGTPFWNTPWFSETPGAPEMIKEMVEDAARGNAGRAEITVNLPSGTHVFDFSIRPVRNDESEVIRLVFEAIDLTDRRHAEEKLLQSQKLETIGQLTGGIAHDFNNLLTPVIGTLDFVRRKVTGDPVIEELLEGALRSAERGRVLIQRLLAFARRQPLQAKPVDVRALIAGMEDLIARSLDPRIAVTLDMAQILPPVLVDANQLELAILNLAVNARDAMPNGGTLGISADVQEVGAHHRVLDEGRYVVIEIKDSGEGMDAATVERAIEPFFSTKAVGQGTGLGLSMVHGFASQSGGMIDIVSELGVGTTIRMFLPLAEEACEVVVQNPDPSHANAAGKTVLLVDDEALVRLSCAEGLRDLGFEVIDVGTPGAALDLLAGGIRPDILVTDYLMPGMTGLELSQQVAHTYTAIPVLLITGYANLTSEQTSDISILQKPFNHNELAHRIQQIIAMNAGG